jgi:hypothetical protein
MADGLAVLGGNLWPSQAGKSNSRAGCMREAPPLDQRLRVPEVIPAALLTRGGTKGLSSSEVDHRCLIHLIDWRGCVPTVQDLLTASGWIHDPDLGEQNRSGSYRLSDCRRRRIAGLLEARVGTHGLFF